MADKKIIIVGGGLAGLVASIHLTRAGVPCLVVEKRSYPFHRVCGEYVSNEVVPYLKSLDAYPSELFPAQIGQFQLTSTNGKSTSLSLDLGGFGISRFRFDHFLFQKAQRQGVEFRVDSEVERISFEKDRFILQARGEFLEADVVIGSFGKRSRIDVNFNRPFIVRRSPYVGVKYHIRLKSFPAGLIALHNFNHGYCGISRVENDIVNLCYLAHRDALKVSGNIRAMEEAVLFQNPFLKKIFEEAEFLFERPETINEISFETKSPVHDHVLMAGDAAGMITPLCGNGMAMAIHSAKILSEHVLLFCQDENNSREQLERNYSKAWTKLFARRLWAGRHIQRLFGDAWASNLAVNLARNVRPVAKYLMTQTHGVPF